MKRIKIISIPLVCSLLLGACMGDLPDSEAYLEELRKEQKEAQQIAEADQTEETEETEAIEYKYDSSKFMKAPWNIKETVLYDKYDVKITAKDIIRLNNEGFYAVTFWVENYSNNDLYITPEDVYVNTLDFGYYMFETTEVKKQTCDVAYAALYDPYLERFCINDIGRLDIKLKAENANNALIFETDLTTLKTNYFDEMQLPKLRKGTVVADSDELFAMAYIVYDERGGDYLLEVFATNKTDKRIKLCTPVLDFGGDNIREGIRFYIEPGLSIDNYYSLDDKTIQKSVSGKIETLDISFGFRYLNTMDCDWESEVVTIPINYEETDPLMQPSSSYDEEEPTESEEDTEETDETTEET